jgi:hypothetical protein
MLIITSVFTIFYLRNDLECFQIDKIMYNNYPNLDKILWYVMIKKMSIFNHCKYYRFWVDHLM